MQVSAFTLLHTREQATHSRCAPPEPDSLSSLAPVDSALRSVRDLLVLGAHSQLRSTLPASAPAAPAEPVRAPVSFSPRSARRCSSAPSHPPRLRSHGRTKSHRLTLHSHRTVPTHETPRTPFSAPYLRLSRCPPSRSASAQEPREGRSRRRPGPRMLSSPTRSRPQRERGSTGTRAFAGSAPVPRPCASCRTDQRLHCAHSHQITSPKTQGCVPMLGRSRSTRTLCACTDEHALVARSASQAMLYATDGIDSPEDLAKPMVGVANVWSVPDLCAFAS